MSALLNGRSHANAPPPTSQVRLVLRYLSTPSVTPGSAIAMRATSSSVCTENTLPRGAGGSAGAVHRDAVGGELGGHVRGSVGRDHRLRVVTANFDDELDVLLGTVGIPV